MNDGKISRRVAAGVALVAVPLVGMQLYLKHRAAVAAPRTAMEDAVDQTLERLRQVDASLIRYREVGKIDTRLAGPRAICLAGGRETPTTQPNTTSFAAGPATLLVAGNNLIRLIADGNVRDISLGDRPFCLATDGDAIFVGFRDHVEVYGFGGTRQSAWPALPAGALLTGIAVGASDVYLADSGRQVVVHADRSGKVLGEFGRANQSPGAPGLLLPSPHLHVAIAEDGTVWANNTGRHRMENYAPDGTFERFWGVYGTNAEGFIGCCNPTDFALLADGSFITAEKGVARVKHYLPDGRVDCFVASPAAFAENTPGVGLAAAPDGRVFVLDRGAGLVHVFEKTSGGTP